MNKTYWHRVLLAVCLLPIHLLNAQIESQGKISAINLGEQFTYYSKILDETRTANIYLPEYYYESSEDHRYPVIYVNGDHGDRFFHTTAGLVRHLSYVERMPEAIVVSFHDSFSYAPDVYNNGMWGSQEKLEFDADPAPFIKHLEEEFFPYLESNFRATDYRIIVGVSGSGLFPLHSFTRAPELFDAHFIHACADVIGMGYSAGKTFIDAMEESFQKDPTRKDILYFGVPEGDLGWQEDYVQNLEDLKKRILPFESDNFKIKIDVIENEQHYDSYIKALLAGLELVFPQEKWSPKYRDIVKQKGNALANIDAFYTGLSAEYGFTILPKANRWNNVNCLRFIGSRFLLDDRTEEAIEVLLRWTKYRPRSPEAMNQLANGYKVNNQLELAISTMKKAITLAQKYDPKVVKDYEASLKEWSETE